MPAYPNPDRSRAILIGSGRFEHTDQLSNLPAVRNNLSDLRKALTDPETGVFWQERCATISDPPTPLKFVETLRWNAYQAEDLLLVYYSGHGIRRPDHDDLYFAVRNTDFDLLSYSAVAFSVVRDIIEQSPARTKVLILDCCYSGLAVGAMSSVVVDVRDVDVSGTSVIASSPRNEISYAPPKSTYTAFSGELIRILRDGTGIGDGSLTVRALYNALRAALAQRHLPDPQLNSGNESSELVLRKPSVKPPVPPAPPVPSPRPTPDSPGPSPPEPDAGRFEPGTSRLSRELASWIGSFLLWAGVLFFGDFAIGGLIGFVFSTLPGGQRASGDLGLGVTTLVICGILFGVTRVPGIHRAALRRQAQVVPRRGPIDVMKTVALVVLLSFCVLMIVVGATVGTGTSTTGDDGLTDLAVTTTMYLALGEGTVLCVRALIRRRLRAVVSEPG